MSQPVYLKPRRNIHGEFPGSNLSVQAGAVYRASWNPYLAICADLPDGKRLGLKPGEFVWCDADGAELPQPLHPDLAAVWDGNQVRDNWETRLYTRQSHLKIAVGRFMGKRTNHQAIVTWEEVGGGVHALPLCLDVSNHSPSGFEWGYYGSGPSQLALAILCAVTDASTAELLHGRFKDEFIGGIARDYWEMPGNFVRGWVAGALKRLAEEEAPNG